ncbi:NAD(P)-dependent oxidoreductase [Pendulispora albinea]|uniref:NAD(P)-binding domain-containing protein n=1 Tax=Pendulispora albinea TaxID=2741071 RepID=A0ABZ2LUJ4_9BACT
MSKVQVNDAEAPTKRRIAVLGAGRMGSALVLALLARGFAVTVWNRTASKCAPLAAKGARVAGSVEDAVSGSDVIIGNVSDYPTSLELVQPPAVTKALRERLFVQLATGTPRQAKEMAGWAREHQIHYLDGAIMATPEFIGTEGGHILYSGPKELFEANQPVFAALGGHVYVGANVGHASTLDASLLIVLWGSLFGALQGAALSEAEDYPVDEFASSLEATMPVLTSAVLSTLKRIDKRRFEADESTFSSVETCYASARLIHQMNEEHGLHRGLTEALDKIFRHVTDAGHAQSDVAALYLAIAAARGANPANPANP